MTVPLIAPIVEGEGEVYALPVLLRRIALEVLGVPHIEIRKPWRVPRGRITNASEIGRVSRVLATACHGRHGGILVLYDLDDDPCPVESARAVAGLMHGSVRSEVVVACREFEAWFLSAASSLVAHRAVDDAAEYTSNPERTRDAKGAMEALMVEPYRPTLHQAGFCGLMSLDQALEGSRSFRRLVSATSALVTVGIRDSDGPGA